MDKDSDKYANIHWAGHLTPGRKTSDKQPGRLYMYNIDSSHGKKLIHVGKNKAHKRLFYKEI